MASLEQLLVTERVARSRIEKLIENGKKTAIAKRTQGFFETKTAELQKAWDEYCKVDNAINEILLSTTEGEEHSYITEDKFSYIEQKCSEYMGDLTDGLRSLLPTPVVQTDTSNVQSKPTIIQEESILPKIALPKFNGNYDTWRSFHDLFLSLVHNNTRLSAVQKLHHLKACLVGEAEKVLRHTPITASDYKLAWDKLKERYDNKRMLVNHQLKTLVNQTKLATESAKTIKSLVDTTDECLQQLLNLGVDTSKWDILLVYLLVQRLPFITLKLWEEEQGATKDLPTLEQFLTFLRTRLRVLESISDAVGSKHTQSKPEAKETRAYHTVKENRCPACNDAHFVQKCSKYLRMDVQARRKLLKATGRCLNCISKNHTVQDCTSKHRCYRCNGKHHTTLHVDTQLKEHNAKPKNKSSQGQHPNTGKDSTEVNRPQQVDQYTESNTTQHPNTGKDSTEVNRPQRVDQLEESNTTQNCMHTETYNAMLATALVRVQLEHKKTHILRCLVDMGSQSSFISQDACKRIGATCTPTAVQIKGLNTSPTADIRQQTTLKLKSCSSNTTTVEEDFLVVDKITDTLPSTIIPRKEWRHLRGLQLADPSYWKPGKVEMLLGARVVALIIRNGVRRSKATAPIAIKTLFGWILLGPTMQIPNIQPSSFLATNSDNEINAQLKRFWEIEEIPTKPILTEEEEECETIFLETHQRLDTGKYQVQLLFKNNETPTLGESRAQALKRFESLQRKFSKHSEFEAKYKQCMNEYIELGHMVEVNAPQENELNYYIPHHAVLKDSSTTKLRVVFDASAKTRNGRSLNDCLLKRPTIQPTLCAILLNWRKHKIAMHADIEKMYRMIKVHPKHHTLQRIIWQHPKTLKVQDYQLTTVTFGTSSAPYLAIRTLQQLADDESERWPLAASSALTDFYVYDLLT